MKNKNEINKNEIRNINIEISHLEKRDDIPDATPKGTQSAGGQKSKLSGYAIVFNILSEPIFGLFKERVMPGALEKTLKEDDQLCLWGHDSMYVLGRKSANTLDLRVDDKGLYFEVTPPNTNWARDLVESVHRGDINQMSFGFKVFDERWIQDKETIKEHRMPIREILGIKLYEISIVSFPAYSQSSVRNHNNEDMYIPTPPKVEDCNLEYNFEDRNIVYDKKIKILKIKNNLI
ncbi:HK97 family phage prohead protease [uncultured Eubacterium sp.]|uniref:HK97 family phage prohead protease n=1 Tax=uncultured Eubacterium sp. TaxID=165185 RepID=UPI0032668A1D